MPSKNRKRASIVIISCAIALMASLGACSKTQSTEKLLADAKQYQQKGDLKAAVIQLKNALQKDPENKDARYFLGVIYNETGDSVSAEKELRKAESLGLSPSSVMPELAKALLRQGQFQKIIDLTSQDPRAKTDANICSLRGNAYLALNKNSESKEAFELALKASPDFSEALIGLAKLAITERDVDTANRYAELAVSKNPKNSQAWLFKADLLRMQGKLDEALAAYEQTIKIAPDNSAAYLVKANLEIGMRKFTEAKSDIDAAKKLSPNPVIAFYTQGLLDFSQNKHAIALESLQQVQKLAPDYMPAVLLSGAVQYALGANEQAEQHLKKYLESNPENVYAQKLMAGILLKSAQPDRAVTLLEPLLKNETADTQLFALAGEAYMQTKNYSKATEYFEKASELSPNLAEFHTALAMSKLGQGDNERAIIELEKAVDMDGKSEKAGILLVMTHLRLKDYDKALLAANVAAKEQPDNPLIHNLKGGIYLNKKNIPEARRNFEKAVSLQPTYFPAVANLARLDIQEKKPEMAKKRFEAILEKEKKNLQAMTALASIEASVGNNEGAKNWLEKANSEDTSSLPITQLLAMQYGRMGLKDKAQVLVKKAQSSNPENPGFMDLLAQVQMASGDKEGALQSYTKLASMLPESPAAQFKVAATHLAMSNDSAAIDALRKTLRIDEKYLDAQLTLAALLAKKGNFDEALAMSRSVQAQNTKSPVGFVQEGDILLAQKKTNLAIQAYERAFKLAKNGQIVAKIHNALVLDGKVKDADSRMTQWLKEHPEDNNSRIYFAMFNLGKENSRQAGIDQLLTVLKTDPNNVAVLNNLAWALGEEKDKRALGYAEKAHKLSAENPAIMDTLGWILVEQGNLTRGLPLIQKASSLAPDMLDIRYHLAQALAKSGDKVKARKELEQLLSSGKAFAKSEDAKELLKQL
jgi:putative PEP-CTERM system TPR-repeat lipoprotein